MGLRTPPLPTHGLETVHRTLRAPALRRPGSPHALHRALEAGGGIDAGTPHAVYDVPLQDLLRGRGLRRAHVVAWRYLITSGGHVVASAEVPSVGPGVPSPTLASVHHGPFAAETAKVVDAIEHEPAFEAGNYELRLVRIPGVYLMALWLHAEAARDDWIVPLAPAPGRLQPGRRYRIEEVGELLAAAASRSTSSLPPPGKEVRARRPPLAAKSPRARKKSKSVKPATRAKKTTRRKANATSRSR